MKTPTKNPAQIRNELREVSRTIRAMRADFGPQSVTAANRLCGQIGGEIKAAKASGADVIALRPALEIAQAKRAALRYELAQAEQHKAALLKLQRDPAACRPALFSAISDALEAERAAAHRVALQLAAEYGGRAAAEVAGWEIGGRRFPVRILPGFYRMKDGPAAVLDWGGVRLVAAPVNAKEAERLKYWVNDDLPAVRAIVREDGRRTLTKPAQSAPALISALLPYL